MKKMFLAIVAAIVMVFANFAFADVIQETDVTVQIGDITATSQASANASSASDARSRSILINNEAPNFTVAPLLSAFINAPKADSPLGWKQIRCDVFYNTFTIRQLKNMIADESWIKGRGPFFYSLMNSEVEKAIRDFNRKDLNDDTVIKIINVAPRWGMGSVVGSAEGVGKYNSPADQILAKTLLALVKETGETQMVVYWDFFFEQINKASSVGVGFSASNTNGNNAVAGSLGVSGSTAYGLGAVAYRIKAFAFKGVSNKFFLCDEQETLSYVTPYKTPQTKACDPTEIFERIKRLEEKVKSCKRKSYNNLTLRSPLGDANVELYQCTGEKKYLYAAIKHYEMAELNYREGWDIKSHQSASEEIIAQVYYNWAGCIYELYGHDAAVQFAAEKHLERFPKGFVR